MESPPIPETEWDLLHSATEDPIRQMIAVELANPEQLTETRRRLHSSAASPVEITFLPVEGQAEQALKNASMVLHGAVPDRLPTLLLLDDMLEPTAT